MACFAPNRLLIAFLALVPFQTFAQSAAETEFAREILSQLQERSFAENREYCGTIGISGDGRFVASRARRGGRNGCLPPSPRGVKEVIASFHTHAAFDPDADSELPSPRDIYSDAREGTDGYIATPGGRFWYVDGENLTASLICGIGCLQVDPAFVPGMWGPIRTFYTVEELEQRLEFGG